MTPLHGIQEYGEDTQLANNPNPLVFVAEDDADDRRQVERAFNKAKKKEFLESFKNGAELIERLKEKAPDCILLDMDMPVKDGFDVLHFLEGQGMESIPVFVMSSSDVHQEILEEKGCKPTGFLKKPVSHQEFTDAFNKLG